MQRAVRILALVAVLSMTFSVAYAGN
ncbi:MAG: hypothetical protein HW378_1881, partial [Anaerolineales bacterium]|nr:hypothetical protein [Anaerolineales bacterium]